MWNLIKVYIWTILTPNQKILIDIMKSNWSNFLEFLPSEAVLLFRMQMEATILVFSSGEIHKKHIHFCYDNVGPRMKTTIC